MPTNSEENDERCVCEVESARGINTRPVKLAHPEPFSKQHNAQSTRVSAPLIIPVTSPLRSSSDF